MYVINMSYTYDKMKPVTLYVSESTYNVYQAQAVKVGKKTAELIREAMDDYAKYHFKKSLELKDLGIEKHNLKLKPGAKDFLEDDSWKDEMLSPELNYGSN